MKAILFVLLISVLYFVKAQPVPFAPDTDFRPERKVKRQVPKFDLPGVTTMASPADPNAGNQAPNLIGQVVGSPDSVIAKPPPDGDFSIQYHGQGQPVPRKYGDCVAFKQGGETVNFAKFKEPVFCYVYQDDVCGSRQHPIPVPLAGEINVQNVLNAGSTLSGSYNCYKATDAIMRLFDLKNKAGGGTGEAGSPKGA